MEKLRNLKGKGVKNKYDVEEVENVYDTVDEREYSARVQSRQHDDWIEDGACWVGARFRPDSLARTQLTIKRNTNIIVCISFESCVVSTFSSPAFNAHTFFCDFIEFTKLQ